MSDAVRENSAWVVPVVSGLASAFKRSLNRPVLEAICDDAEETFSGLCSDSKFGKFCLVIVALWNIDLCISMVLQLRRVSPEQIMPRGDVAENQGKHGGKSFVASNLVSAT